MKILHEYKGRHHYIFEYEKTDYYCPHCGKQDVWDEQGGGDYYVGTTHRCTACGHAFYLPNGTFEARDEVGKSILEQLRTGKTFEPTTPKGN